MKSGESYQALSSNASCWNVSLRRGPMPHQMDSSDRVKIRHIVNALRVFSKTSDIPARLAPRRALMDSEWRGANCAEY